MEHNSSKSDRILAMLIPLSSLFSTFLIPLIIWLFKHDDSPLIDFYGRQLFNFIINMFLLPFIVLSLAIGLTVASGITIVLIPFIPMIWAAFALFCALFGLFYVLCVLYAAIQAYAGNYYYYPVLFNFIRMKSNH